MLTKEEQELLGTDKWLEIHHMYMYLSRKLSPEELGYIKIENKANPNRPGWKPPGIKTMFGNAMFSSKIDKEYKKEIAWALGELATLESISEKCSKRKSSLFRVLTSFFQSSNFSFIFLSQLGNLCPPCINMENILYGNATGGQKSGLSRENLSSAEIRQISALKDIIRVATSMLKFDFQYRDLEEEMRLSDELESFLGKEKFIELFFTEEEKASYNSAKERYKVIAESKKPEIIALQDELDPERLYKAYKYKPRLRWFTEEGVRKMLENPHITKRDKKFFVFNLDQVQDGGWIEVDYKELIYNNFVKQDKDE